METWPDFTSGMDFRCKQKQKHRDYIPGKNGLILSCNFTRVIDTEKLAGNFQVAKFLNPSSSIH